MWWLLACEIGLSSLDLPMTLAGEGVVAQVVRERSCQGSAVRVGLWGGGFQTKGHALASVVEEEDGSVWLHFSVQTGLGEAVAAMRVEGNAAVVPMGIRPGEFELHLTATEMDESAIQLHVETSTQRLKEETSFWQQGKFLLTSEEDVVGEIRFRGDKNPIVSVHDAWWLTPRPVEASQETSGAEIVLGFEAQPSLKGESALMRINAPLRSVVVPMGPVPVPEERRFRLEPGELSDRDRGVAIEAASIESSEMEKRYLQSMIPKLSEAAFVGEGECRQVTELDEQWALMLQGYDVVLSAVRDGCAVGIEPTRKQHGRTFRGVITP